MASLTTLFEEKSRLLSIGELEKVGNTNILPLMIYAGGETFVIPDAKTLADFLAACRDGQFQPGIDRTEFDVLWKVSRTDDTAAIGIRWRNMDRFNCEIARLEATYHCKNTSLGWRVVLVELAQPLDVLFPDWRLRGQFGTA